eukprot:scaffold213597_cov56-Attheya_sp.AAC.1
MPHGNWQQVELFRFRELIGALLTGIGHAASFRFRSTIYEAYMPHGNWQQVEIFRFRELIGALLTNDTELVLTPTSVHQEDSIKLDGKQYPIEKIKGQTVWPNPSYNNLPELDAFMVQAGIGYGFGFQMTLGRSHRLDIRGTNAVLQYFDSVCHSKKQCPPTYRIFFIVPTDIYDNLSNTEQPFTEKGIKVDGSVTAQSGRESSSGCSKFD